MSDILDEELNASFVRPSIEYKGQPLAEYTEGSRLLMVQCKEPQDSSVYFKLAKACPRITQGACFVSWVRACPALSFEIAMDAVHGKSCGKPIYGKVKTTYRKKGKLVSAYVNKQVGSQKKPCEEAYFQTWKRAVPLCKSEINQWSSNTRLQASVAGNQNAKGSSNDNRPNILRGLFGAGGFLTPNH